MDLQSLGMDSPIPDDAQSEAYNWHPKFIAMWADRCVDMYKKYGWKVANDYAKDFFSPELLVLINKEINQRKTK